MSNSRRKSSKPDTDTIRRIAESNYVISNWLEKGMPKLTQLVSKSKKSTLSDDEKFLKKYLEELGAEYKKSKNGRSTSSLVNERSTKKKEAAAVRRSAGPQLASRDSHMELANAAETFRRKRVRLNIVTLLFSNVTML